MSTPGPDRPAGDESADSAAPAEPEPPAAPSEPVRHISGADLLAQRLGTAASQSPPPPRPSTSDLEIFFSLLGYHYGSGTLSAEEFSERWSKVEAAKSLDQLYEMTADLAFPPPLAHISDRTTTRPARRRRWFR